MNVHLTFDIEVWPLDWSRPQETVDAGFDRHILGRSSRGDYGLPKALEILKRHGLRAIFFVEPLFSHFAGRARLQQIVDLVLEAGHAVQLHLHPEWLSVLEHPQLPRMTGRRPMLNAYTLEEQCQIIAVAKATLESCSGQQISAFRAGNYGADLSTLEALRRNGIQIDYSANECGGTAHTLAQRVHGACMLTIEGLTEYPVSNFIDGSNKRRPSQVTAIGVSEFTSHLWQCHAQGQHDYVIVSHGKELLKPDSNEPSLVLIQRFERMCAFLGQHSDVFSTVGLPTANDEPPVIWPAPSVKVPAHTTVMRMAAQLASRFV